jgi:hypothetical protein
LAPTVGILGVGIMNSTTFLLLANINPEVDENKEMELTIESLSFYVGPSGSTRLSDLAKSGSSVSKVKRITISGSSVGSSGEVNSPVSLIAIEDMKKRLEEFDETRGKPNMEATMVKPHDSPRNFATRSNGVSRSVHQLCVIITEAAKENNHEGNEEVDTSQTYLQFLMLHACFYTICLVFHYTSWHFYAISRTNLLTRC